MTGYNYFASYTVDDLLVGRTPLSVKTGFETLIDTISDKRISVLNSLSGKATMIGGLNFIHETGEVYDTNHKKTLFFVPQANIHVVLGHIHERIRKDQKRSKPKLINVIRSRLLKTR